MANNKAALRYAKSLFALASEQNAREDLFRDAQMIANTVKNAHDLQVMLKSPVIKADKKATVLRTVFGSQIHKLTDGFITLITKKGREALLADIFDAYIDLYRRSLGIVQARLTSAVTLSEETKAKIAGRMQLAKDKLVWEEKVNPALIGGFILRVDDTQVDTSVASSLRRIERELTKN